MTTEATSIPGTADIFADTVISETESLYRLG